MFSIFIENILKAFHFVITDLLLICDRNTLFYD